MRLKVVTRRVRHLGTIRHMAELRNPILACLATATACEHAIARFKWNPFYRCTLTSRRYGRSCRPKHIFCDPIFRGYKPSAPRLLWRPRGVRPFLSRKSSRAVDRTLAASPSIPPTSVMVESRSLFAKQWSGWLVSHGRRAQDTIPPCQVRHVAIVMFDAPHCRDTTSDRMLKQEHA
jgi:hypothetical protein